MTTGTDTAPAPPRARAKGERPDIDRAGRRPLRDATVVTLPTVLALGLCLVQITSRSLGLDESASVAIASQHGGALGSAIAHDGGNMSGYYALLHVWMGIFGHGVLALRAPSAIAASATVALVGMLGLRLFDWRVALAAGLLCAVSLPLVFWGQAARGYAPMLALVTGSFLAFVALVDERGGRGAWLAYVACTALAAYAGFVAVLVVPAQLLALWFYRRRVRSVMWAVAICVVSWVPLVVLALRRGSGQLFWVPRPSLTAAKQVAQSLTSSGLEPNFHATSTTTALLVLTLAVLAVVAARILSSSDSGGGPPLLLSWLLVPVVLVAVESAVGQSIFLPRNLLVSLPAVALLLAYAIFDRRVHSVVQWSALLALLALRALQLAPAYGVSPENWKAAASFMATRARPADCVAFYPSDGRMAFRYYLGTPEPRPVLPAAPWAEVKPYVEDYAAPPPAQLARLPSSCPRLWLVSAHVGQLGGPQRSRANYERYLHLRSRLSSEYGSPAAAVFGYAPPVRVELFTGAASTR